MADFDDFAVQELQRWQGQGRLRSRRVIAATRGSEILCDGEWRANFSSNDYLGFAQRTELVGSAHAALLRYGMGATASRLVVGNFDENEQLEAELRQWLGVSGVCLFSSGYAANLGTISALVGRDDVIFSDELNHASLIDGCRLSKATLIVYRHGDVDDLRTKLAQFRGPASHKALVVTESLFSMDGDIVDLVGIDSVRREYNAGLLVDEAHAIGVLGAKGRGVCASVGVTPTILIATFGKALGGYGAFVATSAPIAELLWNRARSLVFATGLPPAVIAASRAAVVLAQSEVGDNCRLVLQSTVARVKTALGHNGTHIVPFVVGRDEDAVLLQNQLARQAMVVAAIRPPTVPEGTARLRISLTSLHRHEQIDKLLKAMDK